MSVCLSSAVYYLNMHISAYTVKTQVVLRTRDISDFFVRAPGRIMVHTSHLQRFSSVDKHAPRCIHIFVSSNTLAQCKFYSSKLLFWDVFLRVFLQASLLASLLASLVAFADTHALRL